MYIYQSDYLTIAKHDDLMVQQWTNATLSVDDYKRELLLFLHLFHKLKPKDLLWDNKSCNLHIPESLDQWMEVEVLVPIYKKGLKRLILTVPEQTSVHVSVVKSLEKAASLLRPIYFMDRDEAEFHAKQAIEPIGNTTKMEANCLYVTGEPHFDVNLKVSPNDLPIVLNALNQIEFDKEFMLTHQRFFDSLTQQELKILKLIAKGYTNHEAGARLFIEESSVKTHRRNIKQKLKIKTSFDMYQYARSFSLFL
jgi:DNA-binding CsgD family transcriptional regulator